MIIVGLTGGIASGKSFVVKYLKTLKFPVHESDSVVANLYNSCDKNFINFLFKNGFKNSLLQNKIDKKIIREEIFNKKEKKIILEKYLHNEIKKKRNIFLQNNKEKEIVFLDIPLLFENKLENKCDIICSTIAPVHIREKRALQRQGMKKKIFKQIVYNQVKDKERKEKSNYLINTTFTKKKTCLQVDSIIYDVLNKKNERGSSRYRNNWLKL